MASSFALALTAAITACGGGSSDAASSTTQQASDTAPGPVQAASASVGETFTTTNSSAVADVTGGATTDTTASAPVVAGTSASTSTSTADTSSTASTSDDTTVASAANDTVVASTASTPAQGTHAVVPAAAQRPAGNTGKGFYVAGGKLYDPKGNEFRIRGVNRNHWDSSGSPAGIALSGANTERIVLSFTNTTTYNWNIISTQMLPNKIVPMPGNWTGTCKADVASLTAIVDAWVAQASTWTQLNNNGLINIANEWGPSNSTVWRDAYIDAIARMRAAGYTGTLVVDTGGCGQDAQDIIKYGAAVLASDPQKNILFDVHVYGSFHYPATATWMQDYDTAMSQMKATGLSIVLGEFGPGNNIGPSPTMITPEHVIATAEANGWGWLPWSWDGNNLPNCMADDNGFSLTTYCGRYRTMDDLTTFGKLIVTALQKTAVKASID